MRRGCFVAGFGVCLFVAGCMRPREMAVDDLPAMRTGAELIVSGVVISRKESRLDTWLTHRGSFRQDVCLQVQHTFRGLAGEKVCFTQFSTEYPENKRPIAGVPTGERILVFLENVEGVWRPPVDFEKTWLGLHCEASCGMPLRAGNEEERMTELLLRSDPGHAEERRAAAVGIAVHQALHVAGQETVRKELIALLAAGPGREMERSLCGSLERLPGGGHASCAE
jgi:hypothetical protein